MASGDMSNALSKAYPKVCTVMDQTSPMASRVPSMLIYTEYVMNAIEHQPEVYQSPRDDGIVSHFVRVDNRTSYHQQL